MTQTLRSLWKLTSCAYHCCEYLLQRLQFGNFYENSNFWDLKYMFKHICIGHHFKKEGINKTVFTRVFQH